MTLSGAPGQTRPILYIGETDLLQRRMAHYRSPGPTQSTNIRMNALLREHLSEGGTADLAYVSEVSARTGSDESGPVPLDLASKAARRLVENAALVSAFLVGDTKIENIE